MQRVKPLQLNEGDIVELFVRGGKNIPKVYERCIVCYFGFKYAVFQNERGKEFMRKISSVEVRSH